MSKVLITFFSASGVTKRLWFREPSIIDSFSEQYDFSGKTVVPFARSVGSRLVDPADNFRALLPSVTVLDGKRFKASVTEIVLKECFGEVAGK